jgi:type III secretory pathway lipoprotein EscJ
VLIPLHLRCDIVVLVNDGILAHPFTPDTAPLGLTVDISDIAEALDALEGMECPQCRQLPSDYPPG